MINPERLIQHLGAEYVSDNLLSAEDSLGSLHFHLMKRGLLVIDERADRRETWCQNVTSALQATLPNASQAGRERTGTLLTPLGRLSYELRVQRDHHGHLVAFTLQLDGSSPPCLHGHPVYHFRISCSPGGHSAAMTKKDPDAPWNHSLPPTLNAQARAVAAASLRAICSPETERHARIHEALHELPQALRTLRAREDELRQAQHELNVHLEADPLAFHS